jgi:arabinofuranan 3-O-arabinosyltransferase
MMTAFGARLLQRFGRTARGRQDADEVAAPHPATAGRGAWTARRRQHPVTGGRWFLLIWLLALIILAANDPGRMFFDTKLGVDINAAGFYARLWHLWDPLAWLGTLQNQYIGYAFPMAPFYLVGQLLHVPNWIIERIWLSLLIAVGYSGLARLATALRIGSERSRLLAGLAFALWPSFTIIIGSTSAAVLPGVLAPWAVLPLVSAAPRGGVIGAAARSGVAVLCMGGVNAVATLDALVLPALFILTQTRGRRRAALAACWALAVALATSWWTVPLLLQGRYSFDFLPYIEQATTTTGTMSAAAFLRGAGNWTAYLNFGAPWLTAGWAMIAAPAAVIASAVVAAGGLAGVARRDMPAACWLRLSMGVAALVALAGYGGPLGGPLHVQVDDLLDGALAPFRNVYKVEQVLATVLALGLAHALARYWPRAGALPGWSGRLRRDSAMVPVAAVALAGLAFPYLSGQVLNPGSFARVPAYWHQLADYLVSRSPQEPALVVPADSHGTYLWGDPIDDPLEPLARSPWVERGLVPYGGAGSQIFLQTAEGAIESGEQVAGLAAYLERAGVRFVVVRNDLDPHMVGYTPPPVVHETLALSGFRRVAAFGPPVTGAQTDPGAPPPVQHVLPTYPAVEVYAPVSAGQQPTGPATVLPVSQTVLADGGPGSLLQLAGQHIIGAQPVVMAGDQLVARPSLWAVSDGLRRADNAFGLITSTVSYTYTAKGTNPVDDPLGGAGGPPRQILPASARGRQTVAVLSGAAQVTASSAGSWLGETTQYDPVNAFDGNPATSWAEGVPGSPVGQWIQIKFEHPMSLPGGAAIRLLDDGSARSMADHLEVSTAAGKVSTTVAPTGASQRLRVPPGSTGWLRITITGVRGGTPGGPGAGVSDVLIPGVRVTGFLQPAEDAAGRLAPSLAFSFQQQIPSPATLANAAAYPPLARTFVTPGPETLRMTATAVALPGKALDALLGRLTPASRRAIQVSASSTLGSLPSLAAANLLRGTKATAWIAGAPNPVIRLSWHGDRRIGEMILAPAAGFASAPASVQITSPDGTRAGKVGLGGVVDFAPLTTNRVDISFPTVQAAGLASSGAGQPIRPVGLSRLSIPGLAGLHPEVPVPAARFSLACGKGPVLSVDGRRYLTAVSGTVGDLIHFLPVGIRLCAPAGALRLGQGRHWLATAVPGPFMITNVGLTGGGAAGTGSALATSGRSAATRAQPRSLRVLGWRPEHRSLRIGPGPASYIEVHQNANPGWVATLGGRPLTGVRLDGWQQGFVAPAGSGGIVTLTFAPAAFYHVWIILSALGVVALLAVAIATRRSLPSWPAVATSRVRHAGLSPAMLAGASAWAGLAALGGLILVVGGPVALAVPILAGLACWWPRSLPLLACAGLLAAGVLTALAVNPAATGSGAFGAPAQACALIALAAALMPRLGSGRGWHSDGGSHDSR